MKTFNVYLLVEGVPSAHHHSIVVLGSIWIAVGIGLPIRESSVGGSLAVDTLVRDSKFL